MISVVDCAAAELHETAKPARLPWLDAARGIGIVLVAFGHSLGGIIDSPMGTNALIRQAFVAIYIFHMPLFFILSGLMVPRRIHRDRRGFGRSLLGDLVWPYFLWSFVQFTLIYSLGSLVNQPVETFWPVVASLPVTPISQFWFLYALLLLHGFALLAFRSLGRVGFLLVCLSLKPIVMIVALPTAIKLAAMNAPWYGIGAFLGASGLAELVGDRTKGARFLVFLVLSILLIGLTLAALPALFPRISIAAAKAADLADLAWSIAAFPAALCAALTIVGLAMSSSGFPGDVLALLGRRSMPIFVLHIMGIAGTRIALTKLMTPPSVYLVITLSVIVGLTMPLAVFALATRVRLTRQLGLGGV